MKSKPVVITNIILLCIIIIALILIMIFGMTGKFPAISSKMILEESYNIDNINEVKMNLKNYDIEIINGDTNQIKLEIYSNKEKKNIAVNKTGNNLEVMQVGSTFCFGFCFSSQKVVLTIPKEQNILFDLKTVSGDIDSHVNFLNENNKVHSTSGDISLQNVSSGDIRTVSGNVSLENMIKGNIETVSGDVIVASLKDGKVSTTSGDINISNTSLIEATSTSGEIIIGSLIGHGAIETTSGDIIVKHLELIDNMNVNSISGDVEIKLFNDALILTNTKSGDVKTKNTRGEHELKIETTSGDILVK